MKIIRYQDRDGMVHYGRQNGDGTTSRIEGDIFGEFIITGDLAQISKLLAPIAPSQLFCIGLNYRFHAEESGAKIPDFPVLFLKGLGTVQNPNDPILLPTHLK